MSQKDIEAEVLRMETECVLKIFPEFEKTQSSQLAMVLELVSLQWISSSLLVKKHKREADRMNQVIMSIVFRSMNSFDDFEKSIIKAKILDQNIMVPALQLWMKTKESIHNYLQKSRAIG